MEEDLAFDLVYEVVGEWTDYVLKQWKISFFQLTHQVPQNQGVLRYNKMAMNVIEDFQYIPTPNPLYDKHEIPCLSFHYKYFIFSTPFIPFSLFSIWVLFFFLLMHAGKFSLS